MSKTITPISMLGLLLVMPMGVSAQHASEHDHEMQVGKKGDFMFDQTMQVGDVTLPAGHYSFQHRVDGSEHYVLFTALKGKRDSFSGAERPASGAKDLGEVKCRIEQLDGKAKVTKIHWSKQGDSGLISRVEVKGETVAHIF